ncbi:Transmembrane protease serine 11D [Coemansia sp. Cherry 401B]|nr:Transmembrane protease serine 11D [Coemansia sp. RSA 2705]KAJ2711685.1 Transmembrane protease serine 11D [Coemansia sp. Cherry 401B]
MPLLSKRIVGGSPAPTHEYPFAVYLSIETQPSWHAVCGGTLVSNQHVVTAAHCIYHAPSASAVKVGLGSAQVKRQTRVVGGELFVHPQFNMRTLANDIAVVRLARPVAMSEWQHRIPVYFGPVHAGLTVTTMGWGITSNDPGARTVPTMNRVDLQVAEAHKCRRVDAMFAGSDGPFVCTSTMPGNRDECNGDSGSPAVVDMRELARGQLRRRSGKLLKTSRRRGRQGSSRDMRLVALTSYGDNTRHDEHPPCGDPDGFGFSTHVAYYREFLTNATGMTQAQLEAPVLMDRQATLTSAAPGRPADVWPSVLAVLALLALLRAMNRPL